MTSVFTNEDNVNLLLSLYNQHGPNWTKITTFIPGSTRKSCCTAYRRHQMHREWTEEENQQLLSLMCNEVYDQDIYAFVAKRMKNRTKEQVKRQYLKLINAKPKRRRWDFSEKYRLAQGLEETISRSRKMIRNKKTYFRVRKNLKNFVELTKDLILSHTLEDHQIEKLKEVLSRELSTQHIAQILDLPDPVVKRYIHRISRKQFVPTRAHAFEFYDILLDAGYNMEDVAQLMNDAFPGLNLTRKECIHFYEFLTV